MTNQAAASEYLGNFVEKQIREQIIKLLSYIVKLDHYDTMTTRQQNTVKRNQDAIFDTLDRYREMIPAAIVESIESHAAEASLIASSIVDNNISLHGIIDKTLFDQAAADIEMHRSTIKSINEIL